MTLTATVILSCRACGSVAHAETPAELCPGSGQHLHIKTEGDDNKVTAWYRSHHQPGATVVSVHKEGST